MCRQLAGALVSNCGPPLHREISGKAFTSALTRLVNDRSTHETVKKEALKQIETWVKEHQGNSDFDLMADTYEALKRQGAWESGPLRPALPIADWIADNSRRLGDRSRLSTSPAADSERTGEHAFLGVREGSIRNS